MCSSQEQTQQQSREEHPQPPPPIKPPPDPLFSSFHRAEGCTAPAVRGSILYNSAEPSSALSQGLAHPAGLQLFTVHRSSGRRKIKRRSPPVCSPASLPSHHCPVVSLNPSLSVTLKLGKTFLWPQRMTRR